MFVDRVKVNVVAGDGGDGMMSFRREAYVPLGGPYGGDGGRGGNIVFVADSHKSTLLDLRYNRLIKASHGQAGKNKKMHGRDAEDTIIKVPVGTIVTDTEKGIVIADLIRPGQREVIAHGGRGGRGNTRFASAKNPAPNFAEKGELGQSLEITIELKLLADVGIIGFPSVGKSTLLSVISRAKPEIADYHFTTIAPNLGIAQSPDGRSFPVADLPGLIEDAHLGKGLGHVFLKHIERCRVLTHVVDMGAEDGRDPVEDYRIINEELAKYDEKLTHKPMVVVANKMDMDGAQENLERFKEAYPGVKVYELITMVGEGVDQLLYALADILDETVEEAVEEQSESVVYKYEAPKREFDVERVNAETYRVAGDAIDRIFRQFEFDSEESVIQFGLAMKRLGVDQALRDAGARDGDTVILADVQFIFDEGMVE
ncbi:GTPase ObgE [Erysipelothrix inopinata]|uniref:GTPase Obg n=1 Tax=Erysipelothrix inopinata TaxID=225084 RepID=A0A7G9RXP8_9FIRM|nr:GTPase ObgE [Erysipelothrix inopinata]QNN60373.1 GTPase ObgE [Erysipelothrix inopinata]